ncbi:phosphonate C-P lyase system protein PhnG [Paenibacillus sp. GP183]|jgi:alpha-D-ribose 1-methylphosphonate 5-triphosphate synthase subunit PhnG|uniref:phosphonate C-P lyase system protein PhnG n=1 Tax=Paenibacillus sp. GP183 TaxID=1882751 RepID=UPI0008999345|nr:phosphonate C-P lyase system protein PhnG [Paenibacillus sp. GP183]SEC62198.1 alpha-D-ribose 1-methylphosphonate 5-triphosphate synthase subunit PhnG [Paenibacillus sp. GP183]
MKRSRRTKVLVEGNRSLLERLTSEIEASSNVRTVRSPETSLVMGKARDSVSGQPFFIGEILVTECTVELDGTTGFGICLGEEPEKAYCLAVVDAAFQAGHPEIPVWTELLHEEEEQLELREKQELERILQTKVHFETAEEYYAKRS